MDRDMPDPDGAKHEIILLGTRVKVPAGDLLLRCFLFLFGNRISYGRFCWNNECGNCEVRCLLPGDKKEHTIRACMYEVCDGMHITHVPVEFRVFMQAPEEGAGEPADGPTRGGGAAIR